MEQVGPRKRTEGSCYCSKVMPNHTRDGGVAKRGDQDDGVTEEVERTEVGLREGCAGMSAAVATLIEGHGMVALGGEGREDLAPGEGEFGKAMNEDDQLGVLFRGVGGEGFKDVEDEAVRTCVDVAGGNSGREGERWKCGWGGVLRWCVLVCVCHGDYGFTA